MTTSIDPQIYSDLANETVRQYGELRQDFPQKMAKRLKRKFRAAVDVATILTLANRFKEIYGFGSSILKGFITPVEAGYASLKNVKIEDFLNALLERYPDEDRSIIKIIGDWVIYYEYLR